MLTGGLKTPKNTTSALSELVFCLKINILSEFLVIVVSKIMVLETNRVSEMLVLETSLVSEMLLLETNLVSGLFYSKQNTSVEINTQSKFIGGIIF